jgi:hypothetical protein
VIRRQVESDEMKKTTIRATTRGVSLPSEEYLVGGWTGIPLDDIDHTIERLLDKGTDRDDEKVAVARLKAGGIYPGHEKWVNDPSMLPALMVLRSRHFLGRPRLEGAWRLYPNFKASDLIVGLYMGPNLFLPPAPSA